MDDQFSLNNIDSLLFQYALQTRELSQKKNAINQQIKVCRAAIAERRTIIEQILNKNKKLDLEIRVKQSTVIHNKENAKSTKATNSLLLQYEETLRDELESRRASYNHDTVSGQQPITEPEKQLKSQTEEDSDSSIDLSSLHLSHTKNSHKTSVDANTGEICEENLVQDIRARSPFPEEASHEVWSRQQVEDQTWPDVIQEQEHETGPEDQFSVVYTFREAFMLEVFSAQEQQSTVSDVGEAEEEMDDRVAVEEEQAPSEEDNEGPAAFPQTSYQENNPQSSLAKMTAVPSTPTFPFNFSPTSSPHRGPSETKSPAFLFSLNPDPGTPGFSGFGFDVGSSQDEDSSFTFTGSFFNEKKTKESKSSDCPEFLFGQPEQSEDFEFAFSSKSPQTTNEDKTKDDFSFSFNF
ncbi:hypothetical protein L3Q82_017424 [Scortum barcoo]|uniref:Uncharacterized protein n=1 Tax=Scortum barcoo TaxID=214431 RepID=A0ACB8VKG9_9TELE|nr:hypothetical protein L3Q82_017424 [Scortum barcoo]